MYGHFRIFSNIKGELTDVTFWRMEKYGQTF
jgi:hypothetical protein